MARRISWKLVLGVLAACAAPAYAQVGPPVDRDWSPPTAHQDAVVQPVSQQTSSPQSQTDAAPQRRALRDESSMPLMAPASTAEPADQSSSSTVSGGWARSLASVALVIGLILVLAAATRFISRRSGSVAAMMGPGGRAPSGVLEVLARYPVGRGQTLVLLRIDRRILLLSQSTTGKGSGFTTLAQFDEPGEVAAILRQTQDEASESISARFRQAMERFQGGEEQAERGEIIEVGPRGEPLRKGRGLWA